MRRLLPLPGAGDAAWVWPLPSGMVGRGQPWTWVGACSRGPGVAGAPTGTHVQAPGETWHQLNTHQPPHHPAAAPVTFRSFQLIRRVGPGGQHRAEAEKCSPGPRALGRQGPGPRPNPTARGATAGRLWRAILTCSQLRTPRPRPQGAQKGPISGLS